MTTLKLSNAAVSVSLAFTCALSACGVDPDAHFDKDKKKYGVNDANVRTNEGGATVDRDRPRTEVRVDGEDINSIRQDPDEIIFRSRYQGTMLRPTLKFLYTQPVVGTTVEEVDPEDSAFYHDISVFGQVLRQGSGPAIERLVQMPIELIAEQTAGDEHAAIYRQHVSAPFGEEDNDLDVFADNSETGTQVYDRHLTHGDCPDSLVCINRAQNLPEAGTGQTFCYYNASGENIAVPVGLSPGASYELVKDLPQEYGPFTVRRFGIEGVDCAETGFTPVSENKIMISLGFTRSPEILEQANEDNQTAEKIDFGVTVYVDMLNDQGRRRPHNTQPYLDTATGFQSATAYYFNNASGRLLKIVKTFRKEFSGMPLTAGYQGLVVNIGFRFCESLLAKNAEDFCQEDQP